MSDENIYLQYTTRQKRIDDLLKVGCDSALLYISKFPYIIPANIPKEIKRAAENKKFEELRKFCSQVENSKKLLSPNILLPEIPGSISFTAKNKGRLLVNHTGGIVENSNLSLHRFFGCPIIPGAALKGIARNAARFDEDQKRFGRVFGGVEKGKSDNSGSVSFLMAIPEKDDWKLVVDVLTAHGGVDTKNPVPVFFPAVEKGATFRFVIAPTSRTEDGDLKFAARYLKFALAENGVGAKTAAGYGWFGEMQDIDAVDPVAEVTSWSILGLEEHLKDILNSQSAEKQKCYLERMIKEKKSLIRKWRNKGNPNFELINGLAQNLGMELPE